MHPVHRSVQIEDGANGVSPENFSANIQSEGHHKK